MYNLRISYDNVYLTIFSAHRSRTSVKTYSFRSGFICSLVCNDVTKAPWKTSIQVSMYNLRISYDNVYLNIFSAHRIHSGFWLLDLHTSCNLMLPIIFYHTQHTLIFSTIYRFFEYKHVLEVLWYLY